MFCVDFARCSNLRSRGRVWCDGQSDDQGTPEGVGAHELCVWPAIVPPRAGRFSAPRPGVQMISHRTRVTRHACRTSVRPSSSAWALHSHLGEVSEKRSAAARHPIARHADAANVSRNRSHTKVHPPAGFRSAAAMRYRRKSFLFKDLTTCIAIDCCRRTGTSQHAENNQFRCNS